MYWSPIFVCGNPEGKRVTRILAINLNNEDSPLLLDNGECLFGTQQIKRVRYVENGTLHDNPDAEFKKIQEYVLENGCEEEYKRSRRTAYGNDLADTMNAFRWQVQQ
jgi:hypothetical protein